VFNTLGKTLGLAGGTVAIIAVPVAAVWLGLSLALGHNLDERNARQAEDQNPKTA